MEKDELTPEEFYKDYDGFTMRIGGTTYEVGLHFDPKGRQCVLEQFMDLLDRFETEQKAS